MARKLLSFLRATVTDGAVRLDAYKSTPAFGNDPGQQEHFRAIRVYRRTEADFVFGEDYAEYFDGMSYRDAELIFEGPLPSSNGRKFSYENRDVEVGSTYAYWMGAADGEPVGPAPVKVRDPEIWWSQTRLDRAMEELKSDYPDQVGISAVGRTVRGREIRAIRVGKADRCVGFIGAVHAGESGAELMLPAFGRILEHHGDLLDRVSLTAIPVVNPDERARLARGLPWYLRTNANGVDLNRNFPARWQSVEHGYGLDSSDPQSGTYRGPRPASEPETRAVMDFLREHPVEAVYSFHALAGICGMLFLAPACGADNAEYVEKCRNFSMTYGLGMDSNFLSFPADKVLRFSGSAGSLPAWCCDELGIPAFDVEMLPEFEPDAWAQARTDRTDLALLEEYRRRHAGGILAVMEKMTD